MLFKSIPEKYENGREKRVKRKGKWSTTKDKKGN
jgi:hypothetical protein